MCSDKFIDRCVDECVGMCMTGSLATEGMTMSVPGPQTAEGFL